MAAPYATRRWSRTILTPFIARRISESFVGVSVHLTDRMLILSKKIKVMKSTSLWVVFLLAVSMSYGQNRQENPKLVVGIVGDQMRREYLDRFYERFGDGGFRRMMNQGFDVRNGHYNYFPTVTGPGHASVYTGTTPAVHGII